MSKRYGQWAGDPRGYPEDLDRCIFEDFREYIGKQCERKRGYGRDGQYCKVHAKRYPAIEQEPSK